MCRVSRRVFDDTDRDRIRSFFRTNMTDQTGFPLLSKAHDRTLGIVSTLRVVEDPTSEISAAIYASGNPEDAIRWRKRGEDWAADLIESEMLMVHEVAVRLQDRRRGLAAGLIRDVIDDARGSGRSVVVAVFDDTQPGLAEFYRALRFRILERAERLDLAFSASPNAGLAFPQDSPVHRWAVFVIDPRRAEIVAH